jgi:predicted HicB family RNase H-like nuclease
MNNNMEYKGYLGSVEFSEEEAVFFGKIMNIRSLISYEGKNVMELSEQFSSLNLKKKGMVNMLNSFLRLGIKN